MKKLYKVSPHKEFFDNKAKNEIEKATKRNKAAHNRMISRKKRKKINDDYLAQIGVPQTKTTKIRTRSNGRRKTELITEIPAPKEFSLISHTEKALAFIDQIWENRMKQKLYIDLSEITLLTPESILYLRSIFDIIKQTQPSIKSINGNYPNNEQCREMLCVSGFTEYIQTSKINKRTSPDYLKIISGRKVEPEVFNQAVSFVVNKRGGSRTKTQNNTQTVFLECVGNTVDHAYNRTHNYAPKWWAMAYSSQDKVTFTILDNGLGIPATMKMRKTERLKNILSGLNIRLVPEHELALHAFTQKERSRLGTYNRGKGLPKIYEFAKENYFKKMIVLSNRAYIDLLDESNSKDYPKMLRGTLFLFEADIQELRGASS